MKRMKLLFTLALPLILSQDLQAQTSSRLIAEAHWSSTGAVFIPVDSTHFTYSNDRGGDLNHIQKYDNSNTWYYDTVYHNSWAYSQTFDANNNIATATSQYWDGTTWILYSKTLYSYNSSNQMTSKIMQSWGGSSWQPVSKNVYSYNISGNLETDVYHTWDTLTLAFVAASQKTYYYDLMNRMINETDQNLTGSPVYTYQWAYTYADSNVLTIAYNVWDGSGWANNNLVTNAYDSSDNRTSQLFQYWDAMTSAYVNSSLDLYSNFTSNHMPQTDIRQWWDNTGSGSWVNQMRYMHSYNSFGQLVNTVGESWSLAGIFQFALGDPKANYYYETYTTSNNTAVKHVTNTNGTANVYPVPAQNVLNVDLKWNQAQAAVISICDVAGRVVAQMNVPVANTFSGSIPVANLANGTYIVRIDGTNGQVVKQIVVSH